MNYHVTRSTNAIAALLSLLLLAGTLPVQAAGTPETPENGHDHAEEGQRPGDDHDDHKDHEEADHPEEAADTHAKDEHGHEGEHEGEETLGARLDGTKRDEADIVVKPLALSPLPTIFKAPGEVRANHYRSSVVTPRIAAIVNKRHAVLGQSVKKGQPLAELFSVEVAEAQGDFLMAEQEWRRVAKLGKEVVSEKRHTETLLSRQRAKAKLKTYGLTDDQVASLARGRMEQKLGYFSLLAMEAGIVAKDHFQLGEMIEPGRPLFEVVDESVMWIEAKLTPEQARQVKPGNSATVHYALGKREATVLQIHRQMDEVTRTVGVRLGVENPDGAFRPGQFVDVDIATTGPLVTSLPTEAVVRGSDGDWVVFVETPEGVLQPKEVEVVRSTNGRTVIDGIPVGTMVVTRGAFFVQSEIAKSGFDIHNH